MKKDKTDLVVIGGGPSGMMCAIRAAERGKRVVILDGNRQLGRKLRITGKGRCNLTNVAEETERKIMSERAMRYIKTALNLREQQIIKMRYGLCGMEQLTQREIAEKLGISRSYVSRIEKSALEKLKNALG